MRSGGIMKRLALSIFVILALCSMAKAEFKIYDANGAYLGILLDIGGDISNNFDIYNPKTGYIFKLNTVRQEVCISLSKIAQVKGMLRNTQAYAWLS
jgi:hypothetical protein